MGLESLMSSRAALGLAAGVGRTMPPPVARRIASMLGAFGATRRGAAMNRAIRLNQWVMSGMTLAGDELDDAIRGVLRNAALAQYELYRHIDDPEGILEIMDVDQSAERLLEHAAEPSEGTLVLGPHVGNFDLGLQALGRRGLRAQVLSVPNPGGGYQRQNEQREQAGLTLTPASKESVVRAIATLRDGGTVGTGVDRPIEAQHYRPRFFGHPAPLPVTHVRLAFKTGAPVFLVAAHRRADGRFDLKASDPLYLDDQGESAAATVREAERILKVAEDLIVYDPQQWLMFYPVWPDLADEVPE